MIAALPGQSARAVGGYSTATLRIKSLTLSLCAGIDNPCDPNQAQWARETGFNTRFGYHANILSTTAGSRALQASTSTTTWCSSWRRFTSWRYLRTSRAAIEHSSHSGRSYPRHDETPHCLAAAGGLVITRYMTLKGLLRMVPEHEPRASNSQYELRLCLAPNCGCGGQV